MPMTRAQLLAEAIDGLTEYIVETDIEPTDTVNNFKSAVDAGLRALGRTSATINDDITDDQESAAIAMVRWKSLERLHDALTTIWQNSQFDGPQSRLQLVDSLKELAGRIARAKDEATSASGGTWGFGVISLDSIEPGAYLYE